MWKLAHRPKHISCGAQSPVAGSWVSFGIFLPAWPWAIRLTYNFYQSPFCRKGGPSAHVFLLLHPREGWLISPPPPPRPYSTCWNPLATDKPSWCTPPAVSEWFSDTCSLGAPSYLQGFIFQLFLFIYLQGFCENNIFATISQLLCG